MTSLFCCPICGSPLTREERSYRCPNRHSYDISKEGYTHLLPANFKHSAAPGDDKEMARSRWEFLSKGYYAPLLEALCRESNARTGTSSVLLDCGCTPRAEFPPRCQAQCPERPPGSCRAACRRAHSG